MAPVRAEPQIPSLLLVDLSVAASVWLGYEPCIPTLRAGEFGSKCCGV